MILAFLVNKVTKVHMHAFKIFRDLMVICCITCTSTGFVPEGVAPVAESIFVRLKKLIFVD